ncbi:cation:dicarboxylate symporter family transporter [Cupriavidus basilensis]
MLIALVLGTALGLFSPRVRPPKLKPLGDAFIKLIKMLIGPIVFCSGGGRHLRAPANEGVGRVGIKAVLYFEVVTTIALAALGIALAYIFHPRHHGMNVNPASLDASAMSAYVDSAERSRAPAWWTSCSS